MRKRTIDVSPGAKEIWLALDMLLYLKDFQPIGYILNTRIRYMFHVLASTRWMWMLEIW